jgi:hypothetical protein
VSLLVPTLLLRWIKADKSSPTRHLFVVAHESSTEWAKLDSLEGLWL